MSRIVWTLGWIGVAVWSLFCALLYGLFDLVGGLLASNADAFSSDPQTVEWVWRVLNAAHDLSTSAVLVGWALVSLLILSVPWILDRLLVPPPAATGRVAMPGGGPGGPMSRGVIDLSPDQYSVGPTRPPVRRERCRASRRGADRLPRGRAAPDARPGTGP